MAVRGSIDCSAIFDSKRRGRRATIVTGRIARGIENGSFVCFHCTSLNQRLSCHMPMAESIQAATGIVDSDLNLAHHMPNDQVHSTPISFFGEMPAPFDSASPDGAARAFAENKYGSGPMVVF